MVPGPQVRGDQQIRPHRGTRWPINSLSAGRFLLCLGQPPLMKCFDFSEMTLDSIRGDGRDYLCPRGHCPDAAATCADHRGVQFGAIWSGKLKMFLQSFGIGTVITAGRMSPRLGRLVRLVYLRLMVFCHRPERHPVPDPCELK